jgi:ribosomal protein S18 acetylase RimI-like enzyme
MGSDDLNFPIQGAGSAIKLAVVKEWPTEAIVDIYKEASWWQESENARKAIPEMISGSFIFIVAVSGNQTVGMGRVISDGFSDGYIQDVAVHRDFRKMGIGGAIISALSQLAVKRGIVWLGLIAEPGTTKFYRELGFKVMEGFVPMRLPTTEMP